MPGLNKAMNSKSQNEMPFTRRTMNGVKRLFVTAAPTIACTAAIIFMTPRAPAQSRQVPAPPQSKPILIHSAQVHPVSGPAIDGGWISFDGGKITGLGKGPPPAIPGAEVIDAGGLHVYPGLIAPDTQLGLHETGSLDETIDHTEQGEYKPEVRAIVAVNPDSELLPVTRSIGILTAATLPMGGTISGHGSIIRLDGWTWEELGIAREAALVVNWPRTEPISAPWMERGEGQQRIEIEAQVRKITEFFDDAQAYLRAKIYDHTIPSDLRYEGLRSALEGREPVFVRASSSGQIESAVAVLGERGMRVVILGGAEADRVIPLLKERDIPVILGGTHRLPPSRHDAYDRAFTIPARLHEAGVRFAIASGAETPHERHLNHNAATAAAYGLPRDVALRSVTLSAAEILGIDALLGSLDAGKAATLIVTTGDPLEITSDVLIAFIDGRRIDLGDRQKMLYAKYREKYRQLGKLQ